MVVANAIFEMASGLREPPDEAEYATRDIQFIAQETP